MDVQPRYTHPFTYAEARLLDIPTITQEISRLSNSLLHLERTQVELGEHLLAERDEELASVLEENTVVIASQRERILILNTVLIEKGVNLQSGHYATSTAPAPTSSASDAMQGSQSAEQEGGTADTDAGLYL